VFPGDGPHRFILFDHDSTFDGDAIAFLKATGLDPTRTGIRAPWQNGIAERWGSRTNFSISRATARSNWPSPRPFWMNSAASCTTT
jgi:hypothetical protein